MYPRSLGTRLTATHGNRTTCNAWENDNTLIVQVGDSDRAFIEVIWTDRPIDRTATSLAVLCYITELVIRRLLPRPIVANATPASAPTPLGVGLSHPR